MALVRKQLFQLNRKLRSSGYCMDMRIKTFYAFSEKFRKLRFLYIMILFMHIINLKKILIL